ncbi:MAG TPA: hypothetical protein VG407_06215 [Caulobacteraceae bacterium]|jgi:hypothetical protein|nr:hypothetical protein [Caulobacteraceae bacterium]
MSDRVYFATALLIALALVTLSFVWPQGYGREAPGPFGKPVVASPAGQADLIAAAKAAANRKAGIAPKAKPPVVISK